jgi:hypothetical protein
VRRTSLGVLILPLLVLAPPIKRAASDPYPLPSPRPIVPEARYLSVSTDHAFPSRQAASRDGQPERRRVSRTFVDFPLLPDRTRSHQGLRRKRRCALSRRSRSLHGPCSGARGARLADDPLAALA